ncbi:molybdopterin-binding protein [Streptomyces sp. NPDC007088]|uniref:molybdopterin molybdotransferase MoeA n=1 Tax=Streptomyces sp. NPDC007088 TaxID=3364773 RepID=UPI0036C6E1E5
MVSGGPAGDRDGETPLQEAPSHEVPADEAPAHEVPFDETPFDEALALVRAETPGEPVAPDPGPPATRERRQRQEGAEYRGGRRPRPEESTSVGPADRPADGPVGPRRGAGSPAPGPGHERAVPRPAPSPRVSPSSGDCGTAPGTRTSASPHRPAVLSWEEAGAAALRAGREVVARTAEVRPAPRTALDAALGLALAEPLKALTDLPSFDTSAMDGWAVAGPGPWLLAEGGVLAGQHQRDAVEDGSAVPIATGAPVPSGTTAVVRTEHGEVDPSGRLHPLRAVLQGQDIRPRGQECRAHDRLLDAGTLITPVVLGLAAAAGYDSVRAVPRPTVEVLVLGDELLTSGLPEQGRIRDALGPMLPSWLRALGAEVRAVRRLGDDEEGLLKAVAGSEADLVLTTGGTAGGPVDHVHPVLDRIGARLLVDGVAVRPGHPMLLAATAPGQHLVGLPGNPLAAVSGLLTLAAPLLRVLAGRAVGQPYAVPAAEGVQGHPRDTRLLPVRLRFGRAEVLRFNGPAMLRGIARAEALAVVPPGGVREGEQLDLLELPWGAGCFT